MAINMGSCIPGPSRDWRGCPRALELTTRHWPMLWKINFPRRCFAPPNAGKQWRMARAHSPKPQPRPLPFDSAHPQRELFCGLGQILSRPEPSSRKSTPRLHLFSVFLSNPPNLHIKSNQHCCHHPFRTWPRFHSQPRSRDGHCCSFDLLQASATRATLFAQSFGNYFPLLFSLFFIFCCQIHHHLRPFLDPFPLASQATVGVIFAFVAFYATIVFFGCAPCSLSRPRTKARKLPTGHPGIDLVPPDEDANSYLIVSADGQGANELSAAESRFRAATHLSSRQPKPS